MRITFMAQKFHCSTEHLALLLFALVPLSTAGCARNPHNAEGISCDRSHIEILQAIRSNEEIRDYAWAHFDSSQTPFLWSAMSKKIEACGTENDGIKIYRPYSPGFDKNNEYVIVYKMYFDDDAAFVEIGFPPTGKNADAFLRKQDGRWLVTDKTLWEN